MTKKIIPLLLIIIIASVLTLNACAQKVQNISLKLGTMPTQTAAIYAIAKEKGFFQQNNLNVTLKVFNSALERDSAASAKQLDAFLTDIMGLVNLTQHGFLYKATSSEYENFSIVTNGASKAKSIADLENKKIAISKNTVTDYVAQKLLAKTTQSYISIPKVPERMAALLSKNVDAAVFPEPFSSMVIAKGGKILASSAKEGMQPVVFVFSDEMLKNNPTAIKSFYHAYSDSVNYLKSHDIKDYKDILIKYGIAKKDTVLKTKLPISHYVTRKPVEKSDVSNIIDWMNKSGMLKTTPSYNDLVYNKE